MAVAVCVNLKDIESTLAALRARMPGIGELEKFRDSLRNLPDPSKLVMNYLEILGQALMPLRNILLVIETIIALVNCIKSIKDAISQLSPGPVTSCISQLITVFGRLAEYIPPLAYLRVMADILLVLIKFLDEVIAVILDLDEQITNIATIIARGTELGDANLILIGDCAKDEIRAVGNNAFFALQTIGRLLAIIIAIISLFQSGGDIDEATQQVSDSQDAIQSAVTQSTGSTLPPLKLLLDTSLLIRGVMIYCYRIASMPLGEFIQPAAIPPLTLANP